MTWNHQSRTGHRGAHCVKPRCYSSNSTRSQRKAGVRPTTGGFTCVTCGRTCASRIGLLSHRRTHPWWDPSYRRLSPSSSSLSVVTYALPSFVGQLSKGDKAPPDSLFRKAFNRGFCCQTFGIDELILAADKKLCRQMSNTRRCLHPLLPNHRNSKTIKESHSGTADITTFYHTSRSTSSKTVFLNRCLFS